MKRLLVTIRLRPAVVASAIALAVTLSSQVGAMADSSISVPVIGQQASPWAGMPLGTSPTDTIGSAGCAVTSVAMMLRYYGVNTDPAAFNAWLTANGGYAFDDQLIWSAVTSYTGGHVAFSAWTGPDLGLIQNELDSDRPVVAEVRLNGNQHFVLITGYSAQGGLVINDPWFADSVNFADRYGDPASGIVSIRTFMAADPARERGGHRVSWLATAIDAVHLTQ